MGQPTRSQHDVLIDLGDQRIPRGPYAGVHRGGRTAPLAFDDSNRPNRLEPAQDGSRSIAAAIVDDDHLERPAVGLRVDRLQRFADPRGSIAHGHHEADAGRRRLRAGPVHAFTMSV